MSKSISSSMFSTLQDFGEVVVAGREELDWVAKGTSRSFSCGSQAVIGEQNR